MSEHEVKRAIANMIQDAPIGKELNITFEGIPKIIKVEFTFMGGWTVKQSIAPGMGVKFIKGDEKYLKYIKITLEEYDGVQLAKTKK
ncbi:hypothetical protein [Aeromonas salmonicida]|uniref:hypothetical protein n=1 Tax=Aeromonas salmonicida TaxID=645 RepID=UPI0030AE4215